MRTRRRPIGSPAAPPSGTSWTTALRLLTRRDHTAAELRDRLLARGYSQDEVDATVDRLVGDRTLDDKRVGALHVRTARDFKGRGRLRIERELLGRGIAAPLVRQLLSDLPAEDEQAQIARILTRKRVPAHLSVAERRRVFQHLLRRGFPAEAIDKALGRHEDE